MDEKMPLLNSQRQSTGLSVSLSQTTEYQCSKCGGKDFEIIYRIRTVSKLVTGSPRDAIIPVTMFRCLNSECNQIAEDLIPPAMKE